MRPARDRARGDARPRASTRARAACPTWPRARSPGRRRWRPARRRAVTAVRRSNRTDPSQSVASSTPSVATRGHQARRAGGEAERAEARRHQPVGERRLVEERLAPVVRDQPVAALDHRRARRRGSRSRRARAGPPPGRGTAGPRRRAPAAIPARTKSRVVRARSGREGHGRGRAVLQVELAAGGQDVLSARTAHRDHDASRPTGCGRTRPPPWAWARRTGSRAPGSAGSG